MTSRCRCRSGSRCRRRWSCGCCGCWCGRSRFSGFRSGSRSWSCVSRRIDDFVRFGLLRVDLFLGSTCRCIDFGSRVTDCRFHGITSGGTARLCSSVDSLVRGSGGSFLSLRGCGINGLFCFFLGPFGCVLGGIIACRKAESESGCDCEMNFHVRVELCVFEFDRVTILKKENLTHSETSTLEFEPQNRHSPTAWSGDIH